MTPVGRLVRVTLPAALPSIATGVRVSASIALLVGVTAEFLAGTRRYRLVHAEAAARRSSSRSCTRPSSSSARSATRSTSCSAPPEPRVVFWVGEERASGGSRSMQRDGCSASAVFVAALGVWEALGTRARHRSWSRRRATVAERGRRGLADDRLPVSVAASVKRLAIGYALGAASGSRSGSCSAPRARTRRTLEPLVEFAARDAADRESCRPRSWSSASATRCRSP